MRIPAKDPEASAAFYHDVFGWMVDTARADPSFEDGSGHVIGLEPWVVAEQLRHSDGGTLVVRAVRSPVA